MIHPHRFVPVYRREILRAATLHDVRPTWLVALVWQESAGGVNVHGQVDPDLLYRYEAGFWRRYMQGKPEWAPPAGAEQGEACEAWKRRLSASYGLCQIMFPTAVWLGIARETPPERLYDPELNLELAAALLRMLLDKAGGNRKQAWARYNGARSHEDTLYDEKVEAKLAQVEAAGFFAVAGAEM